MRRCCSFKTWQAATVTKTKALQVKTWALETRQTTRVQVHARGDGKPFSACSAQEWFDRAGSPLLRPPLRRARASACQYQEISQIGGKLNIMPN